MEAVSEVVLEPLLLVRLQRVRRLVLSHICDGVLRGAEGEMMGIARERVDAGDMARARAVGKGLGASHLQKPNIGLRCGRKGGSASLKGPP